MVQDLTARRVIEELPRYAEAAHRSLVPGRAHGDGELTADATHHEVVFDDRDARASRVPGRASPGPW